MIVLALDTALSATSVAILEGETVLAVRSEPMERGHQERVGGLVRDAVAAAGRPFTAIDRIGVTVGPGSFTGLRVGLAFAKSLALALGVPCVGVGTLQALAAGVPGPGLVAATIDARRGQLYLQVFRRGEPLTEPQALSIEDAQARLAAFQTEPLGLIGSGAALLRLGDETLINLYPYPDPVALVRLAAAAKEPLSPPEPLYLRPPDAKTIAERAAAR